jgi:ribosomal protein S18 acetylase RimI-like enzyme
MLMYQQPATGSERSTQRGSVQIRSMHLDAAAQIAEISAQFGFPVTPGDTRSRLQRWLASFHTQPLVDETTVNIAGLVVDEKSRRNRLDRALMRDAEAWAAYRSLKLVSLRSNIVRDQAHTFYEQLGYERVKTQHAYRKRLAP